MKILAFDTSTEYCTAALLHDDALLLRDVHAGQTHSQLLLPMCQSLLAEASGATRVIACLDARMGEVYHAVYRREAGDWLTESAPLLCAPAQVPGVEGADWCGCGSGFQA